MRDLGRESRTVIFLAYAFFIFERFGQNINDSIFRAAVLITPVELKKMVEEVASQYKIFSIPWPYVINTIIGLNKTQNSNVHRTTGCYSYKTKQITIPTLTKSSIIRCPCV